MSSRADEFATGGSPGKCVKCGVEGTSGNKLFTTNDAGQTVCKGKTACARRANRRSAKVY